jgi:hypothetical protein
MGDKLTLQGTQPGGYAALVYRCDAADRRSTAKVRL